MNVAQIINVLPLQVYVKQPRGLATHKGSQTPLVRMP